MNIYSYIHHIWADDPEWMQKGQLPVPHEKLRLLQEEVGCMITVVQNLHVLASIIEWP